MIIKPERQHQLLLYPKQKSYTTHNLSSHVEMTLLITKYLEEKTFSTTKKMKRNVTVTLWNLIFDGLVNTHA